MAQSTVSVTISEGGRIVIPATFRKAMGVKDGDKLLLRLDDSGLRVMTRAEGLNWAREILAPYLTGPSLAEELLADRRAEVEAEEKADA